MAKAGDGAGIEEHPAALACVDGFLQERIDDSDWTIARSDQFRAVSANKSDMLPRRKSMGRRDWSNGYVDRIAPPVAVGYQSADLWCIFHRGILAIVPDPGAVGIHCIDFIRFMDFIRFIFRVGA